MTRFVCVVADCPNVDVIYDFGDENPAVCECGGCHIMLTAIEEE